MSGCVGRRDGSQFDLGVQKRDKLCRSGNASMLRRRLPGGTGPAGAVACLATSLYIKSKVEENRQARKNQYSPDSGLIGTLSPSRLAGGVRLHIMPQRAETCFATHDGHSVRIIMAAIYSGSPNNSCFQCEYYCSNSANERI